MIFTVFQYMPLIEEENGVQKVEMAKKASQDDLAGDNNNDGDDNGNDSEQNFNFYSPVFFTAFFITGKISFVDSSDHYCYLLEAKDTPPPKI